VKPEDARPEAFAFTTELDFARKVTAWLKDEAANAASLDAAARYAAWATTTAEGKKKHRSGVLFKTPTKLDFMRLVPLHTETARGFPEHTATHLRQREGFQLTDKRRPRAFARPCSACRSPAARSRRRSPSSRW
jgi:hypothetical protein